jgi:hypothetical protein
MGAPEGNQNRLTHGIHALDTGSGLKSLSPFELDNLEDLRQMARSGDGRLELKVEIIARLTLICRKFFADSFNTHDSPRWWDSGPVSHGSHYLSELRRWLESYPPDKQPDLDLAVLDKYKSEDKNASDR